MTIDLSRLAMALMCTPATSLLSEIVFSTLGDIVTQNRARLQSKFVDTLVFLEKEHELRRGDCKCARFWVMMSLVVYVQSFFTAAKKTRVFF